MQIQKIEELPQYSKGKDNDKYQLLPLINMYYWYNEKTNTNVGLPLYERMESIISKVSYRHFVIYLN